MSDANPRFSDEEVDAILSRAMELEDAPEAASPPPGGMSLTELRDVASEVGIRPELIDRAAADVARKSAAPAPLSGTSVFGAPLRRTATRRLGTRLSDEDVSRVLRSLEDHMGHTGAVSEALGRIRWVTSQARLTTEVQFSEERGATRIDVETHYPARMRRALSIVPGTLAAALAVSAGAATGVVGVTLLAGVAASGLMGLGIGRVLWRLTARGAGKRAEQIAGQVAVAAEGLGSPPADR